MCGRLVFQSSSRRRWGTTKKLCSGRTRARLATFLEPMLGPRLKFNNFSKRCLKRCFSAPAAAADNPQRFDTALLLFGGLTALASGLCAWQLSRYGWKVDLLAERARSLSAVPSDVSEGPCVPPPPPPPPPPICARPLTSRAHNRTPPSSAPASPRTSMPPPRRQTPSPPLKSAAACWTPRVRRCCPRAWLQRARPRGSLRCRTPTRGTRW